MNYNPGNPDRSSHRFSTSSDTGRYTQQRRTDSHPLFNPRRNCGVRHAPAVSQYRFDPAQTGRDNRRFTPSSRGVIAAGSFNSKEHRAGAAGLGIMAIPARENRPDLDKSPAPLPDAGSAVSPILGIRREASRRSLRVLIPRDRENCRTARSTAPSEFWMRLIRAGNFLVTDCDQPGENITVATET